MSGLTNSPPLILVADADQSSRELLLRMLAAEGYQVSEASDGIEALRQHSRLHPSLVLLDMLMPGQGGLDICMRLQAEHPVPVIMVSALDDHESAERAFEAGALDYVSKPIYWPTLRHRVRRLVQTAFSRQALFAENLLAQSETLFHELIEQMPVAIALSRAKRFIYVNAAFVRLHDFANAKEIIGRPILDFVAPESQTQVKARSAHLDEDPADSAPQEMISIRRDSTRFHCLVTSARVQLSDGRVTIIFVQDITERKRIEQQAFELALERQRVVLLETFIQDASHDFRTPLTVLQSGAYLLDKFTTLALDELHSIRQQVMAQPSPAMQASIAKLDKNLTYVSGHIRSVSNSSKGLSDLVSSLLDITRMEYQPQFTLVEYDLIALVRSTMADLETQIGERDQVLHFEAPERQLLLMLDIEAFPRVIRNLLTNAIRYTSRHGHIEVRIFLEAQQAVLEVADTGIGIAEADLPHIFERFYRADKARPTDKGGLGLGLAIAKHIVEGHGGRITVESLLGHGTTFRVKLPQVS